MMNRNLVGMGTSVKSPRITPFSRRIKAVIGLSRKSTSPTRTLDASEFAGSFFMKPDNLSLTSSCGWFRSWYTKCPGTDADLSNLGFGGLFVLSGIAFAEGLEGKRSAWFADWLFGNVRLIPLSRLSMLYKPPALPFLDPFELKPFGFRLPIMLLRPFLRPAERWCRCRLSKVSRTLTRALSSSRLQDIKWSNTKSVEKLIRDIEKNHKQIEI